MICEVIDMIKLLNAMSFCVIPGFLFVILIGAIVDPSDTYWAQVGYNMDFTLNPCNYIYCGE